MFPRHFLIFRGSSATRARPPGILAQPSFHLLAGFPCADVCNTLSDSIPILFLFLYPPHLVHNFLIFSLHPMSESSLIFYWVFFSRYSALVQRAPLLNPIERITITFMLCHNRIPFLSSFARFSSVEPVHKKAFL